MFTAYSDGSKMYPGGNNHHINLLVIIPQEQLTMNDGSILICYLVRRLSDCLNVEITLLDGEVYPLPVSDFKDIFEVNRASLPWR